MIDYKNEKKISSMFDHIANKYDFVNRVLSFGIDVYWRKKFVNALQIGNVVSVLDVATGSGDVLFEILKRKGDIRAIGIDISNKMLSVAKEKGLKLNLNADFVLASALKIPFKNDEFNRVSISFGIRNVENVEIALKEMYRVLRPGGILGIIEFSVPKNKIINLFSSFYLRYILPKIGGILTGDFEAYRYLQKTIEEFMTTDEMTKKLKKVGFKTVEINKLAFGVVTIYIAKK